MQSVELAELAIDLRLKYKLDTEMKVKNKYPLTVFRSSNASIVKIKYDSIIKTYSIAIVKNPPRNAENLEDYTTYEKALSKNEMILKILQVLGL